MIDDIEYLSQNFLELASEQRLSILLKLRQEKSKISIIAKELNATDPEVFRNFQRLMKKDLIEKDSDGFYHLTTYGRTVCDQLSSFVFVSKNHKYFKEHGFGIVPSKFIKRIGELSNGELITGFVKVIEKWKEIYKSSEKYLYNILIEASYDEEIVDTILSKLKKEIKVKSIFSETAIITKERKKIETEIKPYLEKDLLKRRMKKDVNVIVVLNERDAAVMFPKKNGEGDMSKMFYSSDPSFHEWCLDYFNDCWKDSSSFQESKLQ